VNSPYRGVKGPLHLLIDSTRIKVEGEGEWNARRHGGLKRRVWRKIDIGIDEQKLEVGAVEITGSNTGDASMLPQMLDQIRRDQQIGSVIADGAYDTRRCHNAIAGRSAAAMIPPRRNAQPWKPTTVGAMARNDALRASRYLGRGHWRNWSGYRRRSRVESKMHCMKLLGQRLMARDFDCQIAEVHVRIAILKGYTVLGILVTKGMGQIRLRNGESHSSADLRNRVRPSRAACPGPISGSHLDSR
jgi:transposase